MAAYDSLKSLVQQAIRTNGNNEITGQVLQNVLMAMIDELGGENGYAGVATPSTNPGATDGKVFYFATEAGTYTHFDGATLAKGIHLLVFNGVTWSHQTLYTIDSEVTSGSNNLITSGAVYTKIINAINALNATVSKSAGADGLSLSLTETGGKVTNISGSIAPQTYDAYGAASAAQIAAATDATNKVNAAKTQILGDAASDYNTLGKLEDKIQAEASRAAAAESALNTAKADKATTLAGYGINDAYTKTEVNGLVSTPHQNYVTVPTYASLPATGSADTIYRVSNYNGSTSQVDASVYSEYAWNGSGYTFLRVVSQIGEVFDITVYNSNTKYADLAAALGANGANVPSSIRRGGMSVKFVQSYDNEYVQFRYMGTEVTGNPNPFLDVHNWQSSDDNVKYIAVEHVASYTEATDGSYFTPDLNIIGYKINNSAAYRVYPNPQNPSASYAITGNEVYLIDNDKYVFMNDVLMKMSRELVNDLTSGGIEKVLSAEQGKILKNSVDGCYDLTVLNSLNPTIETGCYDIVSNVATKNSEATSFNCCKVDVSNIKVVVASFYLESSWGAKSCFTDNNGTVIAQIGCNGNKNVYNVPEGSKWLYISNYNPSANRLIVAFPNGALDAQIIRYNDEISVYDVLLEEYGKKMHESLSVNKASAKNIESDYINVGSVITIVPTDSTKVYRINLVRSDGTYYQSANKYGKSTVITDEKYKSVGIYNNSSSANTFAIDVVYSDGLISAVQNIDYNDFCKKLHPKESKTYIIKDGLTLNLKALDDFGNVLGYLDLYGNIVDSPVSVGCKTVTNNNERDIIISPTIKIGDIVLPLRNDYLRILDCDNKNDSIVYAKYANPQTKIQMSVFDNGESFEVDVIYATDSTTVPDNDVVANIVFKDGRTQSLVNKSMQRNDIEKAIFTKTEGMDYISLSATDLTKLLFVVRKYKSESFVSELTTDIPDNPYPAVLASAVGISPENTGAQNTTAINNAISQYHNVFFDVAGVYEIAGPILYGNYTRLEFVKGCTIKKTQQGSIFYADENGHRENVSIIGNGLIIDTNGFENMSGVYMCQFQLRNTDNIYVSGIECTSTAATKQNMFFMVARDCNNIVFHKIKLYYPKDGLDFGGECSNILIDTYESTTADDPFFFGEGWAFALKTIGHSVKNVLIRNWINHTNPWTDSTYTCRLMTHSWDDWRSGRKYTAKLVGDGAEMCLYDGNLYIAVGNELDSEDNPMPSTVPPTHTSGDVTYSDGYTWRYICDDIDFYSINVENVRFENCKSDGAICAAYQDFTYEPNLHESTIQWEINNCEINGPAISAVKGVEGIYDVTLKNLVYRGEGFFDLKREQNSYPYTEKLDIYLKVENVVFPKTSGGTIFKEPYNYSGAANAFKEITIVNSCLSAINGYLLYNGYAPDVVRVDGSYLRVNGLRGSGYQNGTTYYINETIVEFTSSSAVFFNTSNEDYVVSLYGNNIEWLNFNQTLTYWYLTALSSENVAPVVSITGINLSKHYAVLDSSLNANISDDYDEFDLKKAKDWVKDSIIA